MWAAPVSSEQMQSSPRWLGRALAVAGAPACSCLCPGAPETWLARTPVQEAANISSEDQTCHAMPHLCCTAHCKSLVSVLRWPLPRKIMRLKSWVAAGASDTADLDVQLRLLRILRAHHPDAVTAVMERISPAGVATAVQLQVGTYDHLAAGGCQA